MKLLNLIKRSLFVALILLCGACSTERLFHADFNEDTLGELPETRLGDGYYYPPGDPLDDIIVWDIEHESYSVEINNSNSKFENQYLSYNHILPAFNPLEFYKGSRGGEKQFYAYWQGDFSTSEDAPGIEFRFGLVDFWPEVVLRLKHGMISVQTSGDSEPTFEAIGLYEGDSHSPLHTIIIALDRSTDTYTITLFQGRNHFTTEEKNALDSPLHTGGLYHEDNPSPNLSVKFYDTDRYEESSLSLPYDIDNINITQKKPDMDEMGRE